jgi:hypothetical protein
MAYQYMSTNIDKPKKNVADGKDLLMISLAKFYNGKNTIARIFNIIEGKSEVSLRLIDWFVTNYSKKNNTNITKVVNNNVVHFNVYLSYRSQLKAYSKQQFDPFRRRDRITFYYEKDKSIETTVGQLNFFRWVLQNDILTYIIDHYDEIENDMINTQKVNQDKKGNVDNIKVKVVKTEKGSVVTRRKKRNELSKSSIKNMNKYEGTRLVCFN